MNVRSGHIPSDFLTSILHALITSSLLPTCPANLNITLYCIKIIRKKVILTLRIVSLPHRHNVANFLPYETFLSVTRFFLFLILSFTTTPVTRSKLHFSNSLATVFSEPALQKLLTFLAVKLMSVFRCLGRSKESVPV
jgi:hypothetical protein